MTSVEEFIRKKQREQSAQGGLLYTDITYITAAEYAGNINRSIASVNRNARDGKIPGALKQGSKWMIPVKPSPQGQAEIQRLTAENARLKEKLQTVLSIVQGA